MQRVSSIEQLQEAVRQSDRVRVCGRSTKPALSAGATHSVENLSGVLQYEPSEYTFTALAGTPLQQIAAMLAENGQYLPFDPPLVEAGATLAGTVAAGLSGPGRFRYGGVRDFLLGVRFVNGEGDVVFGGGKVVKNAAGFDLPKLMVGSLGRFGILAELTFKVFPRPQQYASARVDCGDLPSAFNLMTRLATAPAELACLDLVPPSQLWLRVGGLPEALDARIGRLQQVIGANASWLRDRDDADTWRDAREFAWVPDQHDLLKIPLTSGQLTQVESEVESLQEIPARRYSVGGNLFWLTWKRTTDRGPLLRLLQNIGRSALPLTGSWDAIPLASQRRVAFAERIVSVLDPQGKFG